MPLLHTLALLVLSAHLAQLTESECVIELECEECLPEYMPAVTSHRAVNGSVVVAAGAEVRLECPGGRFLAFPLRGALAARCEAGRYRVAPAADLLHLLDLGCQENIFEDVLHEVEGCGAPQQGRVYRSRGAGGAGGARHVAALCFDAERALPAWLALYPALPPHSERGRPLSLLGNFDHMFDAKTRRDAERLYSDETRLNRRLRQLFKHDDFSFAAQSLTTAKLLGAEYMEERDARASDFVSNRVLVWASVAHGNLRRVQRAVARRARGLAVLAGAHGALALPTARGPVAVALQPGGRFPVPRYVWTVVHDPRRSKAVVIVVLNDPFLALGEAEEALPCSSACGAVRGLGALGAWGARPLLGLAACCPLPAAAARLPGLPALNASAGLLTDLYD